MVTVRLDPLPAAQQEKLKKWLLSPECLEITQCVKAELAVLEANISGDLLEGWVGIMQNGKITANAGTDLLRAIAFVNFLKTLEKISAEDYSFSKATPTIE